MNTKKVSELFETSPHQDVLANTAYRLWFVDRLRYRTSIQRGSFDPGRFGFMIDRESNALQAHLLLTCLDAIAGEDFLDFPKWLGISKPGKKTKYDIDDDKIKAILTNGHNLDEPDNFRWAAKQVYTDVYIPSHGKHNTFIQLFIDLPTPMKELMSEAFVISDLVTDVLALEIDSDGRPTNRTIWRVELEKWKISSIDAKLEKVADYYYRILRNPYTHKAESPSVDPFFVSMEQEDSRETFDVINDVVEDKGRSRIVRFKGISIENQTLFLRLVVVVSWLNKVGLVADENFIAGYRDFQIRRDFLVLSLREIERVSIIAQIYKFKTYDNLRNISASWSLMNFPTFAVSNLRRYLRINTPLEGGLDREIKSYLDALEKINVEITNQNEKYIPKDSMFPTDEETKTLKHEMPIAFKVIQDVFKNLDIEKLSSQFYDWLDDLSERMI